MNRIKIHNLLTKIQLKKNVFNAIKKYITIIIKTKNYQNFIMHLAKINYKLNLINFIITVSNKKSNIFIHLLDCLGNEMSFYSIGSKGLSKKYNKEIEVLQNYLKTILNDFNVLKNKPLVLHTLNANYNLNWFIEKITQKLIIQSTKQFVNISYNGCRKKKL